MNAIAFALPHRIASLFRRPAPVVEEPFPSIADSLLKPLFDRAATGESEVMAVQHIVRVGNRLHSLPKFVLADAKSATHKARDVRVGIFAGLDTRSLDTVLATSRLLERCEDAAKGFILSAYPKTNVHAFTNGTAGDYETFQQRTSLHPDDQDATFFREEIRASQFSMILRFRSDPQSQRFHVSVGSSLIARTVVVPTLYPLASRIPIEDDPIRGLSRNRTASGENSALGCLAAPNVRNRSIEIEVHAPGAISQEVRADAMAEIGVGILENYRQLLKFQSML